LTRVGIIADTIALGRAISDLLADEERIQVVSFTVLPHRSRENPSPYIDVIVATSPGLVRSIPPDGPAVLIVGPETGPERNFRDPVRGWLPSNPTSSELSAAVHAVAQNYVVLTEKQGKQLISFGLREQTANSLGESLTPRESEVLLMLADGLGNKEIAKHLGISDHTAKFHVAQILAKLGAGSRAEAVAIGLRRGLVPV
jgi:DNA-binding CsgD family transcriptional regulator